MGGPLWVQVIAAAASSHDATRGALADQGVARASSPEVLPLRNPPHREALGAGPAVG